MTNKPKILCLHGFGENADVFKLRLRHISKMVGDNAELVYVNGPIDVGSLRDTLADIDNEDNDDDGQQHNFVNLAWCWARDGGKTYELRGIGKSLAIIGQVLNKKGPFDGIIGFSQGACFAVMIAALLSGCSTEPQPFGLEINHPPIKFLVLAGGMRFKAPQYSYLYNSESKVTGIPSLHIIGKYDTVVGLENSHKLAEVFKDPRVIEFEGGHFIPQAPTYLRTIADFLSQHISGTSYPPS